MLFRVNEVIDGTNQIICYNVDMKAYAKELVSLFALHCLQTHIFSVCIVSHG